MPSEVANDGIVLPTPPVPPMPSEVTNAHTRTQRPAADAVRPAMSPLRRMMRRARRHA
jgi:anti-sigma B factor antagonist